MSFDWGTALVSGGSTGVLATAVAAFLNRRKLGSDVAKTDADAVAVLSKVAVDLVAPLRERIHELEDEVRRVRASVAEAVGDLDACHAREREKDRLIAELKQPGGT